MQMFWVWFDRSKSTTSQNPNLQNVYDTGAPREADLQYHHEMAYLDYSPEKVAFFAKEVTHNPLKV